MGYTIIVRLWSLTKNSIVPKFYNFIISESLGFSNPNFSEVKDVIHIHHFSNWDLSSSKGNCLFGVSGKNAKKNCLGSTFKILVNGDEFLKCFYSNQLVSDCSSFGEAICYVVLVISGISTSIGNN